MQSALQSVYLLHTVFLSTLTIPSMSVVTEPIKFRYGLKEVLLQREIFLLVTPIYTNCSLQSMVMVTSIVNIFTIVTGES
jgi:hypothetical protein